MKTNEKAAKKLQDSIEELLTYKERVIVGLAGGRGIKTVLEVLKKNIDWEKIHIFLVDERSDLGNSKLIKEELGRYISEDNFHHFVYQNEKEYSKELEKYGGKLDIALISAGEDCHIGSLFPYHQSIKNESEGYIKVENSPKPPLERVTISKNLLKKTKITILIFFGEEKKDAYNKFLSEKEIEKCPALIVKECEKLYVFTDFD